MPHADSVDFEGDEGGELVEPIWSIGRMIVYPICRLLRWRITGLERIPKSGPVILASNHISFLDPIAMLWLTDRRKRRVRFMAKAELWKVRVLRFFLVHTKMIPVSRSSAAAGASLSSAEKSLRDGECICIFPEGTISPDFEPMPAKTGVARIAADAGVPVTPVGIWGTHRLSSLKHPWPRLRLGIPVAVVVGEPVAIAPHDDPFDATDRIMTAVASCVADARRGYTQTPRCREGTWWIRGPETARARPTYRPRPAK